MRTSLFIIIISLLVIAAGCSNSGNSTVVPDSVADMPSMENNSQRGDVHILASGTMNLDDGTIEINNRTVSPYMDVTPYVGSNFSFHIDNLIPPDILDITLELVNLSGLTVYDVYVVFDDLYGKTVMNPDCYIDIFQPWDINPFIVFRKEHALREFPPMGDTEQLLLKYPGGNPYVDFYIIAHLGGNTGGVYAIDTWHVDGVLKPDGGTVDAIVSAHDYQADIGTVVADTSVFTGGITTFTQVGYPNPWEASISNTQHAPVGEYTIPVMASSPSSPMYHTYNFFKIHVADSSATIFGDDIFIFNPGGASHWAGTEGRHNMIADGDNFYLSFNSLYVSPQYWAKGDIHFVKSTDGGETWQEPARLTNEPTYGDILHYTSMAKKGNVLYIAHERVSQSSIYYFDILKSDDDGESWDVWYASTSGKHMPSICVDPYSTEEKVYVAYSEDKESIWVASKNGANPWVFNQVSDIIDPGMDVVYPDIAFNPVSEKIMACWSDEAAVSAGSRVCFDSSSDGVNWGADIFVSVDWMSGLDEKNPILAVNPSTGIAGILYDYNRYPTALDLLFVKSVDANATSFMPEVVVFSSAEFMFSSSLFCEESDRWLASWYSAPDIFTNQDCYFKESMDGGSTWINEQMINDPVHPNAYNPGLASNGSDVCIGWMDQRDIGDEIWIDHGEH
ncbi:exo-alpha-sialidase [bacterium]|nr:exo-alpha-sialidase [bacterium]